MSSQSVTTAVKDDASFSIYSVTDAYFIQLQCQCCQHDVVVWQYSTYLGIFSSRHQH